MGMQMVEQIKREQLKERPPPIQTPLHLPALLRFALLHLVWPEFPDVSGSQEVKYCLVTFVHGQQFKNLHMVASAYFPSCSLPHQLPEYFLLVCSLAAVAEGMLAGLSHSASTPPVRVIFSLCKPL